MYYVVNQEIYDDGYGMQTAPAYGVDAQGSRYELAPEYARELTMRYQAQMSRLPLGDAVARVTKAFGVEPCSPCQRRQAAMNSFGDRLAGWWSGPR